VSLKVDAGRLIKSTAWDEKIRARLLVQGMGRLGYNVANACFQDIAADPAFFEEIQKSAAFTFVSSNIVNSSTRAPYFPPYEIREISGRYRIAVLGISAANQKPVKMPNGTMLTAADPSEFVNRYLKELRDQVHLVVVLAHMPSFDADGLAKSCPGIDLILGGYERQVNFQPRFVNDAYVIYGGDQGKYVGVVDAYPSGDVLDKLGCRIVALDNKFEDDAGMVAFLAPRRPKAPPEPPSRPPEQKIQTFRQADGPTPPAAQTQKK